MLFLLSGFIVDDDGKHLKSLSLKADCDKDNPRKEIDITILLEVFLDLQVDNVTKQFIPEQTLYPHT